MATILYLTQIQFEFGAIRLLKQECERVGIQRPLIVTDPGVKAAGILQQALDALPAPVPQPEDGVTYAAKLGREDGRIDWSRDAASLDRQIRALNPWPGTFTALDGEVFKIHAATLVPGQGTPGETLDDALCIATGDGALRLTRVQAPGRAAMDAAAFLRGHPVPRGTRLG